jgi:hypothetical protein
LNPPLKRLFGPPVPVIAALQIKLVRLNVLGVAPGQQLLLCARQLQPQLIRDFCGDLPPYLLKIYQFAIVLRSSKLRNIQHIHEFGLDAQPISSLNEPSREDRAGIKRNVSMKMRHLYFEFSVVSISFFILI